MSRKTGANSPYWDNHDALQAEIHEFSKKHPQLMQFINEQGHDPDVDRLLEGLSWHAGLLQARLKKDFPELVQNFQQQLWPGYLRPVPAMTILQASPVSALSVLAAETEATCRIENSAPVIFRTCRPLTLFPLYLEGCRTAADDDHSLVISFTVKPGTTLNNLNGLEFYLGNDAHLSRYLYFLLGNCTRSAFVTVNGVEIPLENARLHPVGMSKGEGMLPWPQNANPAHRLIQEYFCFPEGMLFLALNHDNHVLLPRHVHGNSFSLTLRFSRSAAGLRLQKDTLRINCVPAINLFRLDGEPLTISGCKTQYPLKASYMHPEVEIFAVDKIESYERELHGEEYEYKPFTHFEHKRQSAKGQKQLCYHLRLTQNRTTHQIRHWVSVFRSDETLWLSRPEKLSVGLWCCNGDMAAKLALGQLQQTVSLANEVTILKNICRPSLRLPPLMDETQFWFTLSRLARNYQSLLKPGSLSQLLINYHFPALFNRRSEKTVQRMLEGIETMETHPCIRFLAADLPVRGVKTTLTANQHAFGSEGELFLFGTVLAHFFAQCAPLNTFHLFSLLNSTNQERYSWPVTIGQHSLK
ncbi:Uncharacterised protein [Metakosakonia massiliensis]|uniref:Type VI secretion system baseplate subunit TssF n=1 Tax=Phytobacter massiliensis TaxID=1485952 RepID=A0A6N3AMK6_9ENTR